MPAARLPPKSDRATRDDFLRRVRPPEWRNPQPGAHYDLVVVGGGPAGLSAADFARSQGRSVALIERGWLGGNSLNSGTIPSKAIIHAAQELSSLRDEEDYGAVAFTPPAADFAAAMARMRRIRTRVAEYHSAERLRRRGIDLYFCSARFAGSNLLLAGDAPVRFKKAILATGARPKPSDIPGLDRIGYLTSDSIFDLAQLPGRLGIIGGGPLGCELAQAFCRLGSHVTIVQNDPKFLPEVERDAAELLSMSMSRDGVVTRLNTSVVGAHMDHGEKCLDAVNDDVKSSIAVDEVLLTIGRVPNVEYLGLDAAGIDFDPVRGIHVDNFLRTTHTDVYAAGDVCNLHHFTNVADLSARIAVQNAFGAAIPSPDRSQIPWCTYCDPEIAHIGIDVREANRRSIPIKSFTVMMQDVDRAITDGQDDGFVKIYVKDGTDEILGATVAATRASELINEISVIMSAGIGMRRLANILHAYPTQSDAIRLAALAYVNQQSAAMSSNY